MAGVGDRHYGRGVDDLSGPPRSEPTDDPGLAGRIAVWDAEAAAYDDPADHGLRDPAVRAAWSALLLPLLPSAPARVAELGCGTATLSALLAAAGHRVDAVDFSPAMLERARAKVAGLPGSPVRVLAGDAAHPPLTADSYDVVLCRHVLWALPDPVAVLRRWTALLRPGGVLVLVEGSWSTGAGITGAECVALAEAADLEPAHTPLVDPALWGREISDDRYLVVARPRRSVAKQRESGESR